MQMVILHALSMQCKCVHRPPHEDCKAAPGRGDFVILVENRKYFRRQNRKNHYFRQNLQKTQNRYSSPILQDDTNCESRILIRWVGFVFCY